MLDVQFTANAESALAQLDKPIAQRLIKKIRWLAENFDQITPEPLSGQWKGVYKLRVEDYRVLYTVEKKRLSFDFWATGEKFTSN